MSLDSTTVVKAPRSQVQLQAFIYKGNTQKGKDENAAMNHQNPWLFAILSFPSLGLSAHLSNRQPPPAQPPVPEAPFCCPALFRTYCERSVLRAGCGRALLAVRLRAPVERQIVLAGLACIVLSVWHPVLCGNPVLWGWRKWDCGEWLHHCIRSCCWLLVTLEKGESSFITPQKTDGCISLRNHPRSHICFTRFMQISHSLPQSAIFFSIGPCSAESSHWFLITLGQLSHFWVAHGEPSMGFATCSHLKSHENASHAVRHYFERVERLQSLRIAGC